VRLLAAVGFLLAAACGSASSAAGDTLAQAKVRGTLRCGVSEGIAGFSARDAAGRWNGLDADFCRAVAAVALGDAEKVIFVPLRASERFPALKQRQIDLLARNTSWTLLREAGLKVWFVGTLFHDGQAFMVPASGGVKALAALRGTMVCVEKGTTSVQQLADMSADLGLGIKPLVIDSALGVADAFFAGRCQAYTADASQLAAARLRAPGGPQAFAILSERISAEPLGPVVRQDDADWFTLVRWTLYTLIGAEGAGLTRANSRESIRAPALQRAIGATDEIAKVLGTDPGWALRMLQSVGNYGEMYERNVGKDSPLGIERGLNRHWTKGGLMYSPPVR
jgi:general L-amino acid transport system substrate-binding protein